MEVFNVGEYRRKFFNGRKEADWFDNSNTEAVQMREEVNDRAIADMEVFLNTYNNGIVILDSVNASFDRRLEIQSRMHACGAKVLFIEVQNTSESELSTNCIDVATTCPDYKDMDNDAAVCGYLFYMYTLVVE